MSSRLKYRGYILIRDRDGWSAYLDGKTSSETATFETLEEVKDGVDALYESDRAKIEGTSMKREVDRG